MKLFAAVLILCLFPGFHKKKPKKQSSWTIPTQLMNPWAEMGMTRTDTLRVEEFVITKQITLGEYRQYLDALKKDSLDAFYRAQLPDSTMCTPAAYDAYLNSGKYDAFPVCGVTWLSALNYCEWKAEQDHLPDSMMYTLPYLEDWLAANRYLRAENLPNDFNRNYSDWLMDSFDESAYDFMEDLHFSYDYRDYPNDPPVLRRKRYVGNSFHHQHAALGDYYSEYGYSFRGYSYISFRMIKVKATRKPGTFINRVKKKK
jgi:hypothetical protein